jgi:hypothetical protein
MKHTIRFGFEIIEALDKKYIQAIYSALRNVRTTGYELHTMCCLFMMFKGRRVRLESRVVETRLDIIHKVLTLKPH